MPEGDSGCTTKTNRSARMITQPPFDPCSFETKLTLRLDDHGIMQLEFELPHERQAYPSVWCLDLRRAKELRNALTEILDREI